MNSNIDFKKQIILLSVVFVIVVLVLIFVLAYPLLKGIKENSSNLIYVKKELASLKDKEGGIGGLEITYKKIEPDLEKINQLFVDSEVPVDLIKFLERTGADSNVSIKISPFSLKIDEDDSWNSIGFRLNLIGSFNNFMRFFEKIETAPYLIEIQDLSIKKLTESELKLESYQGFSLGDINSSLTIKVYAQ